MKTFDEVRQVLSRHVPAERAFRDAYTLERMQSLMVALGNPQDNYKVIHVAGTSGKTSTCYYLTALLRATGARVGLTVSPHVDEVNERVQIGLKPLSEFKFCREFSIFMRLVEKIGLDPTYFELLVGFAYWEFNREKVDYAIVEVGLGGLLDGTNVVTRSDKVCVITDIGLDHTSVLGNSLSAITTQKAGIILPHNTVYMYEQDEEVMRVAREVCGQLQAELHEIWPLQAAELPKNLPLYQRRNWYLALQTSQFIIKRDELPELTQDLLSETTKTYVPSRMEIIEQGGKVIVLDGAHNPQKMEALAGSMKVRFKGEPVAVLFSLIKSKKLRMQETLRRVATVADHLIITSFEAEQDMHKVSVDPLTVAESCEELGIKSWEIVDNPTQAYKKLIKRPEKVLLITGSFYLQSTIRPLVKNHVSRT